MVEKLQKLRAKITFAGQVIIWRLLQVLARPFKADAPSLVLLPCDPGPVIGSRGDEAMIYAVLGDFRTRHPDGKITVICSKPDIVDSEDGKRLSRDFEDIRFAVAWIGHNPLPKIVKAIREARATELYSIGADCMDGFYSPKVSLMLMAVPDLARRMGVKSKITGFSFNEHPDLQVVKAFKCAKLDFNLRDPVSLERFNKLVGGGSLVADVAFCLKPVFSERVNKWLSVMDEDRRRGKKIFGLNLNPMLNSNIDDEVKRLREMGEGTAVYLIPHDYRGKGDLGELEKVYAKFPTAKIVRDILSAGELKALTSGLDLLFTSRMHLGIAALGMGKPIEFHAYQGKFEGLMKHFGDSTNISDSLSKILALAKKNLIEG